MSALSDNLTTVRDQLVATLAAETANPKPSYSISDSNGSRSVNWAEWQRLTMDQIETLTKMIVALNPYVVSTRHTL